MEWAFFAVIMALAAFVQSLTGFGQALVAMPLLVMFLPIQIASPLIAMYGLTINVFVIWRYGGSFRLGEVWRPLLAMLPGVALGVYALRRVDERWVLGILGAVLVGYALYALLTPRTPQVKSRGWGVLAGFLSGVLGGAYNTSGPPLVVYGSSCGWSSNEFRANLQGLFFVSNLTVMLSHLLAGNITWSVGQRYLISLPLCALGLGLGVWMGKHLDAARFQKAVLLLLLVMGIRLLW